MKYEPTCTLSQSALQQASENTRNKHIEEVYEQLICRISNKLDINHNRAWNKFSRFEGKEVSEQNTIKEFYTPYCSVKLIVKRMNYVISFSVTSQSFNAGQGIHSTALLRVAFDVTQHDKNGFRIYDCLQISVSDKIEATYKQKFDQKVDQQNQAYFNKRMRIEG